MHPVQYVRIDPGGEWLCQVHLEQPLRCWIAQLAHSRDVVAQAEAVAALGKHSAPAAIAALARCVADETVYYRVRADAARALAVRDGVSEGTHVLCLLLGVWYLMSTSDDGWASMLLEPVVRLLPKRV